MPTPMGEHRFAASTGPTISASQINSYLICPLKYRFTYVDKLPKPWKASALAFGSAVHSALEAWQLSRLSGEELPIEDVQKMFLVDWEAEKAGEVRFKDGDEENTLADKGVMLLRLAVEHLREEKPQATELPFTVDLHNPDTGEVSETKLRGVFDLLLPNDRVLEIKTMARKWDETTLQQNLQLTAYHYAYRMLYGRSPTLEVVSLLKYKNPRVERLHARRTIEDDDWFLRLVDNVDRGRRHRVFPPHPGWQCSDCEYAESCRSWRG